MPSDVNLGIDIDKKGSGDKEAALGLELVAKAADNAKDELAQLDRKLLETRAAMLAAGKTFAQTGDQSPLKALLRDERQLQTAQKAISRATDAIAKDLARAGEQGGGNFLRTFANKVSGGLPEVGGVSSGMSSALVYGAIAAAPAIGAALNSAVLLGLGGGAIAGGILLAARDDRVHNAWAEVAKTAKAGLTDAADVFVAPLERSAATFQKTLSGTVIPGLRKDFETLAPAVDRLSAGMSGFVQNALPGLNRAIQSSAPVVGALGDGMSRLGSAVGYAGSQFAFGAAGATDMTEDLITLGDATIRTTATVVGVLSKVYELSHVPGFGGLIQTISAVDEHSKSAQKSFQLFGDQEAIAATQAHAAAFAADQEAAALQKLTQITQGGIGSILSLDQANIQAAATFDAARQSIAQHGRTLTLDSEAGRANRTVLDSSIQAYSEQRDKAIQAAGGVNASKEAVNAANGTYEQSVGKLFDMYGGLQAVTSQGYDAAAALRSIPNVERTVTITYLTTHINRTVSDQGGASAYQQSANALLGQIPQAHGGITLAAARGLVAGAPSILVGERTVPEAAIPAPNSGISEQRASALLGTAASWWGKSVVPAGGGGGHTLNITVNAGWGTDGAEVGQQVLDVLRSEVKTRGGNVQMILAGRPAQ